MFFTRKVDVCPFVLGPYCGEVRGMGVIVTPGVNLRAAIAGTTSEERLTPKLVESPTSATTAME